MIMDHNLVQLSSTGSERRLVFTSHISVFIRVVKSSNFDTTQLCVVPTNF
jgi:hypothetical protein